MSVMRASHHARTFTGFVDNLRKICPKSDLFLTIIEYLGSKLLSVSQGVNSESTICDHGYICKPYMMI